MTVPRFLQALAHLLARRLDDCLNVLGNAFPGVRAMCQHSQGDEAAAIQVVDSLRSTVGSGSEPENHEEMVLYRDISMFYAWIGNAGESLSWLERAFSWSHNAIQFEVMNSGVFDRVSEDPTFQAGLEGMRERIRERLLQAVEG